MSNRAAYVLSAAIIVAALIHGLKRSFSDERPPRPPDRRHPTHERGDRHEHWSRRPRPFGERGVNERGQSVTGSTSHHVRGINKGGRLSS